MNLLNFWHKEKLAELSAKWLLSSLFVLVLFNLIAVNLIDWKLLGFINVVIIGVAAGIFLNQWLFYLMIFLYPYIGWQFVWGSVNVPYVDLMAILVLVGFIVKTMVNWKTAKPRLKDFPGVLFIVAFLLSGLLSMFNAEFIGLAIKYLLRPLAFFYLMFVYLPFNLIKTSDQFKRVLKIMIVTGLIVGFLGALSVLFSNNQSFIGRAVPFNFSGFEPVGGNQNAVAEIIVVTLPLILFLLPQTHSYRGQGWWLLSIIFLLLILLLTLSRSGYLALLLEIIIFSVFWLKKRIKPKVFWSTLVLIIAIPLTIYFSVWQNIDFVQSSNVNRLALSEIAWNAFLEHPIIGNGVGSFMNIIGATFVYVVDFGDPLDSHGFVQKLIVEQGILGLISFCGLLIYIITSLVRAYFQAFREQERYYILCLIMLTVGIIFFELFSTSYYLPRMWIPLGVVLAGLRIYHPKSVERFI